ncbi:hypothetical protein [Paenibacillus sedimenti]|uniref:Uncharacterized protein n=1 Tax=Paenibacillus sedimenti TaxID=2770274 RepID=A0A926KLI7_9BACL|nr:hypothetical protein [Paenibacillus sedimenti]MBD0379875.1 hypothetical protein [Paenibacillus sedimenti]
MKFIISSIDFVPMILFSFILFRQKIQPHWIEILIAIVAGVVVTYANPFPLLYIAILFALFAGFLKFSPVPAMLIALSGYLVSVIVSTVVIFLCDRTGLLTFSSAKEDPLTSNMLLMLAIIAKFGIIFAMMKFRLGFTFLSHYSKIKLCKENAGFYLFILTAIVGIVYQNTLQSSTLSALMPFQMMSMATVIFIYVTLRKELGF